MKIRIKDTLNDNVLFHGPMTKDPIETWSEAFQRIGQSFSGTFNTTVKVDEI